MKSTKYIVLSTFITCLLSTSFAQTINWKALQPSDRHILNVNAAFDNSFTAGIGYGYRLNTAVLNHKMPLLVNIEYSMPMGEKMFDDLKTKIGGQLNVVSLGSFYATARAAGIIRRYKNDMARMINFGSEFSATAGYYKPKWYVAGEGGFDKAITTHIQHSWLMKQINPEVRNGWYLPTGGYFIYNVQGGYSFNRFDVYAKVGRTIYQDLKTTPTLPYYVQLGWNLKL